MKTFVHPVDTLKSKGTITLSQAIRDVMWKHPEWDTWKFGVGDTIHLIMDIKVENPT